LRLGRVFAKTRGTTQIPEAITSGPRWVTAREWSQPRHRPRGSHLALALCRPLRRDLPVSVVAEW